MYKLCNKCKKTKNLTEFSKNQYYCKPCHRESVIASNKKNPEVKKANRLIHMSKELETNRLYKKNNKERINAINRNRKALMKYGRYDNHNHSDVQRLYLLQHGKCAICKVIVNNDYHVDHIIALKNGGANSNDNLQILCPLCNIAKGSKDPIKFMQSKGYLL